MRQTAFSVPRVSILAPADVPGFVAALDAHAVRLVAGLDAAGLADLLAPRPPARPVLRLDLAPDGPAERIIDAAIAQLAGAVAGLWPFLWGGRDFSDLRDDALGRAHLPIRLAALARHLPRLSRAYAGELVPRLLRQPPAGARQAAARVPRVAPEVEWGQLALAFAPAGLIVVVPVDGPPPATGRAAMEPIAPSLVRALEWLAQHADVAVLVLADTIVIDDVPADDRVLFGARRLVGGGTARPSFEAAATAPDAVAPKLLALPEAEGRPHPQSDVELKLFRLIRADSDLAPLFKFNRTVPDLPLLQARADLVWFDGRLVVEIDGPEHRGAAKYRADRHRDFELVCAGYRVLRVTNEDVRDDAARVLEKLRALVRLARREGR